MKIIKPFIILFLLVLPFAMSQAQDIDLSIVKSCPGVDNGSIALQIHADLLEEGPFDILWSTSTGTPLTPSVNDPVDGYSFVENLAPGFYCVTVSSQSCMVESCEIEVEPFVLGPITPSISCICSPNGFGEIGVEVAGASGPYTFKWSGPNGYEDTGKQLSNLTNMGSYSVTVTDSEGCTAIASYQLDFCDFDFSSFNEEVVNACNGPGTGHIEVKIPLSSLQLNPPIDFTWLRTDGPPLTNTQITTDVTEGSSRIDGLDAGEYCLAVTTMNGCQAQSCWTLKEYTCPVVNYQISPVEAGGKGGISLEPENESEILSYTWSNGATTRNVNQLDAGTYTVEIAYGDPARSCVKTLSFEVMDCNDLDGEFYLQAEVKQKSFATINDGAIDLSVLNSDGYLLIYEWTHQSTGQKWYTEDIDNLPAGEYCVSVKLEEGFCPDVVLSACYEICDFGVIILNSQPSCLGSNIRALATPTDGAYTYQWSNGSTDVTTFGNTGENYSVTVTDANGCTAVDDIDLTLPPLTYTYQTTNATLGQSNGSIQVEVQGGIAPYTYAWDNGMSGASISGLPAGAYCVTIKDNCGTTIEACIDVECEIPQSDIVGNVVPVNCSNGNSGSITLELRYSDPNNLFFWSNGANTQDISGLAAGEYCVTILNIATSCSVDKCFEVSANGSGNLSVGIITNKVGCVGGTDNELTAQVSGGASPYTYDWRNYFGVTQRTTKTISDIPMGWWTLVVTDANGCTGSAFTILWGNQVIDASVSVAKNPVCAGETATATVTASGGTAPYDYQWRTCYYPVTNFPNNTPSMSGLEPDCYFVTVTDQKGCRRELYFNVGENPEINVSAEASNICNENKGSISVEVSGGRAPYYYLWSTGRRTSSISNLSAGDYCLTVYDATGCTFEDCYEIQTDLEYLGETVQANDCGSECNGSIDLNLNASGSVAYSWSHGATTQDVDNLCSGEYSVTITSGECELVKTFTVGGVPGGFDYEVNVIWHFGNERFLNGSAYIEIKSDLFELGGEIHIIESNQLAPIFLPTPSVQDFNIPIAFSGVNTFHFTYTAPNGCVYEGSFESIPTCVEESHGITFSVTHLEDSNQGCELGQNNSYQINIIQNNGMNAPYFIVVTMEEASFSQEANYTQKVEYTGQDPFIITGIPAGRVRFSATNNCENGNIMSTSHKNCCFSFSCNKLGEGFTNQYDGSYYYDYPYFRLFTKEECFDRDCSIFDQDCSKINIQTNAAAPQDNCWEGEVEITYPDGSKAKFRVFDDFPFDGIEWVSGEIDWDPPKADNYVVNIKYTGTGDSEGQDCSVDQDIHFYGGTNNRDAIGFNCDFWFDGQKMGVPDQFMNAYFGAWRCEVCSGPGTYIFKNDQDACKNTDNWTFTFFDFTPNSYTEDPCNSGGKLKIIHFTNGIADIQEVDIEPNTSIDQLDNVQPFGNTVNEWCDNAGWCLFDAANIKEYGFSFDKPLLATWSEESTCETVIWDDPVTPNPDPCIPESNDCPLGYQCLEGNCYPECINGECLYGECKNGICVEDEECDPKCPSDQKCIDGNCYIKEKVCGFSHSIDRGSGENTYNFQHDLSPGTTIILEFKTLTREDEIFIEGSGISDHIECVPTGNQWEQRSYVTSGTNRNLRITVKPCENGSRYHLRISCESRFHEQPPNGQKVGSLAHVNQETITVYPNPFLSNIDILASGIEENFEAELVILDRIGRTVLEDQLVFEAGDNRFNIEGLEGLAPGVYIILIKKEGEVFSSEKVVKIE